jgi:phosphoribosylformimino-5-aminoimidazole carboxamide ribotide isomerase
MNRLSLIPVIDLKGGMVVHAREGRRDEYRPVRSKLTPGAEPKTIARALLDLHPFKTLYIADIDAIQQRGNNRTAIQAIRRQWPDLELWVDSGIANDAALTRWLAVDLGHPVIGSESLLDADFLLKVRARVEEVSAVLSIDYLGDEFKGPQALLDNPELYWPGRVLAMNLHRVGSDQGPDLNLIVDLAKRVPGCKVYAAGGVRSVEDLQQVAKAGASGALLASALHDGRIGSSHLAQFSIEAAKGD